MEKTTGLTHLIKSTGYSLKGLKSAFKNEAAFRHEVFCACILIPLAFWLADDKIELILMVGSVLLVLAVELLNSAVEAVVDRVGKEYHELSGRAKDQGSAAVFVTLILVVITWGGILFF
ncbi:MULTISPECIES: diacylglycerol kinase [unclassified Avibacterium]|uniref:diacylglycerol kinase n=1 Tax=unclassified Avibacterium TaxID=2685287 RepID=UPI002025F9EF|nr:MULTISPECIES: diacylglycerol kinase [unclassified Avibacterium]MCW9699889.1 diacylglycerol kinase [Avibacterium sp. 20-129]URL06500.1 diacylglycerol kinase [Avibacterium sp. 21-595]